MKALGQGSIASLVRSLLTIAWYCLWAGAVLLALAATGYASLLALAASGAIDSSALTGQGQFHVGGGGAFDVSLGDLIGPHWPIMVPVFLIGATALAGSLGIVWRLRRLFDSFTSGEPFKRENAQHLRAIWIIMISIEITRYALMVLTGALLAIFEPKVEADIALNIDLSTWGGILILIVLAEIFREGARLREEQELTI